MKTIYWILFISIAVNVILILDEYCLINVIQVQCPDGTVQTYGSGACNDKNRYPSNGVDGGGTEIGVDEAKMLIEGWHNKYESTNPGIIKCAMISKIAIDSMFSYNQSDNVLSIEMGYDEVNGGFAMVVTSKEDDRYKTTTNSTLSEKQYRTQTVCPTQCDIVPTR